MTLTLSFGFLPDDRVARLELELNLARQQVEQYRNQLDQAGTALLGDNSAFKEHMELQTNDSLEGKVTQWFTVVHIPPPTVSVSCRNYCT